MRVYIVNDPRRESQHASGSRPQVRTTHKHGEWRTASQCRQVRKRQDKAASIGEIGWVWRHALNPSARGGKGRGISELQAAGLHSKLKQNKTKKLSK